MHANKQFAGDKKLKLSSMMEHHETLWGGWGKPY